MEWESKYAAHLPALRKAARSGLHVQTLEDRPEVPPHLEPVFQAYADLRHDGGGSGVPFMAIAEWCRVFSAPIPWMLDRLRAVEESISAG